MKVIGLTGGIGMGKSTSAAILARRGVSVIDTDAIAREVVEPGQPVLHEIAATFGAEVIDDQGKLCRSALAEIVFSDPSRRQQLEAILHPRIRARWQKQIADWQHAGERIGVVVIPLLFETNAQESFSAIVCTACSLASQHERLRARGMTNQQIEQRKAAQWPIEKKIAASNFVVWTEGSLDIHERQIERICGCLEVNSPRC
jgi:dephospho-CoA kinase